MRIGVNSYNRIDSYIKGNFAYCPFLLDRFVAVYMAQSVLAALAGLTGFAIARNFRIAMLRLNIGFII